jgi:hypothetical protein
MVRSRIIASDKSHAFDKPRKRGRPPTTGLGSLIGGRWHADDLAAIDAWRMAQADQPDRAEALRRLVRMGLTLTAQKKRRKPPQQE